MAGRTENQSGRLYSRVGVGKKHRQRSTPVARLRGKRLLTPRVPSLRYLGAPVRQVPGILRLVRSYLPSLGRDTTYQPRYLPTSLRYCRLQKPINHSVTFWKTSHSKQGLGSNSSRREAMRLLTSRPSQTVNRVSQSISQPQVDSWSVIPTPRPIYPKTSS